MLLSHAKMVYTCKPNKQAWKVKEGNYLRTQMDILTYKHKHAKYFSEGMHEKDKQVKLKP